MSDKFISTGAFFAALAVIAGAFGAHALKTKLDAGQLQVYETAVRFLFMHAFAIILCGVLLIQYPTKKMLKFAGLFFTIGIVLFSGSLFLLSCRNILEIETWKWLGPVTPLGGTSFILAWCMLAFSFYKKTEN